MKKYLLPSALILLLGLGLAVAQNANRGVQLSQDSTGFVGFDNVQGGIYLPGHLLSNTKLGPAPVLSACITGGSPTLTGTDLSGVIVGGTTASTSCVVTFGTAYQVAPNCVVSWQSGPLAAMSWATSTTALTITQTSNASSKIAYICTSSS